jgi:hypothetical protein
LAQIGGSRQVGFKPLVRSVEHAKSRKPAKAGRIRLARCPARLEQYAQTHCPECEPIDEVDEQQPDSQLTPQPAGILYPMDSTHLVSTVTKTVAQTPMGARRQGENIGLPASNHAEYVTFVTWHSPQSQSGLMVNSAPMSGILPQFKHEAAAYYG